MQHVFFFLVFVFVFNKKLFAFSDWMQIGRIKSTPVFKKLGHYTFHFKFNSPSYKIPTKSCLKWVLRFFFLNLRSHMSKCTLVLVCFSPFPSPSPSITIHFHRTISAKSLIILSLSTTLHVLLNLLEHIAPSTSTLLFSTLSSTPFFSP